MNFEHLSDAAVGSALAEPTTYTVRQRLNVVSRNQNTVIEHLEKFQPGLDYQRGHFITYLPSDFADYVKRVSSPEYTEIFIDTDEMQANAIMNYRIEEYAMGRCDFQATCKAQKTPVFEMLTTYKDCKISQRHFVDLLIDWMPEFTAYNSAGEIVQMPNAIDALRNIEVDYSNSVNSQVQDLSESRSKFEQVSAKTKDTNMPVRFSITNPCFEGLADAVINLRMSITTNDDKPNFKLSIERYELLLRNRVEAFTQLINKMLDGQYNVSIGKFVVAD